MSTIARSFIRKCLALNPADRPTATEALNDVWMTGKHAKDINILDTVRENFNARRAFKSAVSAVKAMNRLRAHSLSRERAVTTPAVPPSQANLHLHSEAEISRVKSAQ
jgi:calcium/calmodulin-dependent protein kinase I